MNGGVTAKPSGAGLLERGIHGLSMAGIPLALAVMTVIALATWAPQYPAGDSAPLELRVIEDPDAALDPAQALRTLGGRPLIEYRDTKLAESPFWFAFAAQPAGAQEVAIELPSRHAQEVQCWQAASLTPLGNATRSGAAGRMRPVKAGFAIDLGAIAKPSAVLCRATYSGPARISALQWRAESLAVSSLEFHRKAGLLEGGFVVLAGFVLVTALLTREGLYVLFAAWLIASLRLGALSAGWDMQWLEHTIPPDWLAAVRKLTIAGYVMLTYALFTRLFREDLRRIGHAVVLAVARWSCVALLAAAALLPFALFLRVMWVTVAVGIAALVFLLARILFVTRSRVALWYTASLAIVLFAGIYEVIAAALGAKLLIGAVNSVTAAFSSSLMVAVAIAEQLREEREQRVMAQAELRETYEALPIGLFTLDREGMLVRGNPALYRILELDPAARGKAWSEHFEAGAWAQLRANLRAGVTRGTELRGAQAAEREPKVYFVKAAWTGEKFEGSLQDITERSKATERLRYLADNDPLTGVLNRRGIEKVLGEAMGALQDGGSIALAYLDLDRFKLINDLFGHVAGDEVLRQVCQRAKGMLGEGHHIGRIGGDEFVIVFCGSPVWLAAGTCRGIVDAIGASPYQTGDKAVQVKGSIGLVEVPAGTRASDALALADRACHSAKAARSDGLMVYERDSPAFGARARELQIFERLGTGAAPRGLFLVMQPIMSLAAPYESLDFEVLVRMRDPDGAVVPAGELFAAAESNGGAAVIDRWVLANTLEWIERNLATLGRTRFVCVNLSGSSLNDERFAQEAFALLARQRRACAKLCIEITEGVALRDLENTRRFIDRVRGLGSRVALDDFGAGYTSFTYLRDLPAEVLKIDGSFVTGVSSDPANLAIVEAIVELARNLGMKTIAEWAEDSATVAALAQAGVDYVQGYAISRPQEPAAILQAKSSAGFISDLEVAHYVRERLAGVYAARVWSESGETPSSGVH